MKRLFLCANCHLRPVDGVLALNGTDYTVNGLAKLTMSWAETPGKFQSNHTHDIKIP
ncbi:MAG: hypothetical protein KF746_01900 [Chitinophagaceae bacterium]|nr:hypothetical protein [Chitinophagaceae bacterium]